jgi:type II secretory pathway component PulF
VGSDGRVRRGHVDAPDRDAAIAQLAREGLHPVALVPRATAGVRRATLSAAEAGLGLRILADLLDSGLALGRALAALETLVSPRWRAVLPGVRQAVREGRSLAAALSAAPVTLSEVALGVIHAGERGSGLTSAVRHAAELCEEAAATRSAVRAALAYPILLATAGSAAVVLLVGIVLPRFAAILGDLGQSLPPTTRLVLGTAAAFRTYGPSAGVALLIALACWYPWVNTADGRRRWHASLLRVPVIGEVRMAAASARMSAALAALLESGVPVGAALSYAARAAGDAALHDRLLRARQSVEHGGRLSAALAEQRATTTLVQRLVHAGEESGRLAAMLSHAARMERERTNRQVRGAVRLIEPLLIIVFGGIVGLVAAALLQALYSVRPGA